MDDFEDDAISRIYGLEIRMSRMERQMEVLLTAILDGDGRSRDGLFTALDMEARFAAMRQRDEEKTLFTSNLNWVREASKDSTANLIDRLLEHLEHRMNAYPTND